MTRKEFMKTFGIAVVAVSVIGIGNTKPEETIIYIYGDGVHDDTVALQALVDGKKVMTVDGSVFKASGKGGFTLPKGKYLFSSVITVPDGIKLNGQGYDTTTLEFIPKGVNIK